MKYQTKNQSTSKEDISPLALWRSTPAGALTTEDFGKLRAQMQRVDLVGEPGWRLARVGDAGSAIGVAIRVAIKRRSSPQVADLAMSAVLAAAMEGNSAARHFLAHMLEKRGANSLAASWVAANRIAALDEPPPRVHSARHQKVSRFAERARAHR